MAATIKIKNSSTAGAAPTSSDLVQGELAVNVTDKRLYTENSGGTVVELGTNPSIPVTFPAGTGSAPSLTASGDTNTGIFFPAADTVGITTGGTERARVDSSGNLGLGVTPSAWGATFTSKALQVGTVSAYYTNTYDNSSHLSNNQYDAGGGTQKYIANGYATDYAQGSGKHVWSTASSGTAGNAITFTQAMTLDASGNLGVGTSSPVTMLDVRGEVSVAYNATYGIRFYNQDRNNWSSIGCNVATGTSSANLVFKDSTGEVARITGGNLLVGTTTNTGNRPLQVYTSGNVANAYLNNARSSAGSEELLRIEYTAVAPNSTQQWFVYANDTSSQRFSVRSNGGIANFQANDANLSDRREKTNFAPAGDYLAKICAIPVQTFNYIDQNLEEDDGLTLGVVAQDVQAVAPELVMESDWSPEKDGSKIRLSIYQTDLQYALMKCIQEQQAIITQLQADVAALKGQA